MCIKIIGDTNSKMLLNNVCPSIISKINSVLKKLDNEDAIQLCSKIENELGSGIVIGNVCPFCGKLSTVKLNKKQMDAYAEFLNGNIRVQEIPNLTPDEREVLLTGICDDCWI